MGVRHRDLTDCRTIQSDFRPERGWGPEGVLSTPTEFFPSETKVYGDSAMLPTAPLQMFFFFFY